MMIIPNEYITLENLFEKKGKDFFGELWTGKEKELPILPYILSEHITRSATERFADGATDDWTNEDENYFCGTALIGCNNYPLEIDDNSFINGISKGYNQNDEVANGTLNNTKFYIFIRGRENYVFQCSRMQGYYPKAQYKIFQDYQRRYYIEYLIKNDVLNNIIQPELLSKDIGNKTSTPTNQWRAETFLIVPDKSYAAKRGAKSITWGGVVIPSNENNIIVIPYGTTLSNNSAMAQAYESYECNYIVLFKEKKKKQNFIENDLIDKLMVGEACSEEEWLDLLYNNTPYHRKSIITQDTEIREDIEIVKSILERHIKKPTKDFSEIVNYLYSNGYIFYCKVYDILKKKKILQNYDNEGSFYKKYKEYANLDLWTKEDAINAICGIKIGYLGTKFNRKPNTEQFTKNLEAAIASKKVIQTEEQYFYPTKIIEWAKSKGFVPNKLLEQLVKEYPTDSIKYKNKQEKRGRPSKKDEVLEKAKQYTENNTEMGWKEICSTLQKEYSDTYTTEEAIKNIFLLRDYNTLKNGNN